LTLWWGSCWREVVVPVSVVAKGAILVTPAEELPDSDQNISFYSKAKGQTR